MSLLSRLFLLVAVALLPAIAIQAYNEVELRHAHEVEVEDQALGLARLAAAEQQQIVQGNRQVLIALSELPAIKAKDVHACNVYLSTLKQRYPEFIGFLAVDTTGHAFCDADGNRKPVSLAGRAYFASALKTGAFSVGEFAIGRLNDRRIIPFAVPFYGYDGRIAGAVTSALGLDWLADSLARRGVSPGSALAIADRNGTILARYPDNDRFVGQKMSLGKYRRMGPSATVDMIDVDGVERIVGYASLPPDAGGLVVSVGFDKTQAFADIQRGTRRGIFLIFVGIALVLILTWLGARYFIHRPLGQLVVAANQWRLGDYACRVAIRKKHAEIAQVGNSFNAMAAALEAHQRELRAAKEKAEGAAARITTVFESTTDSVIIIDRDGRISYLNDRAKAQVADGRDLVGRDLAAAFPDAADADLKTDICTQCQRAILDRRPAVFEAFCSRRNAWYAINAFPSDHGLAVYFRDVTERKRAREAQRLIEEQLHQAQKMEAIGRLTGGVAHDFNNLLTVVAGNLQLIERRVLSDNGVKQLAAEARQAADRGAKLTAQLLAFARQQRLSPELVHPDRLIRDFAGLLRRAGGESCEIKLAGDDPLWPCRADPAQLETALLNLTLNARDAMPDGGVLTIAARNVVFVEETIAGLAPGSYVSLSVADTGCGVPAERLEQVFEPFFTTKGIGKGTGLGLSMVYGFVKQSGGHVTIESAVGVGTTVTLYLPKAAPDFAIARQRVEVSDLSVGSARILAVDDDEQVLRLTTAMLSELGHQVSSARNGSEAIQLLESDPGLDLLLSDVGMHGMNGVELAREARRLRQNIKVLLTSGHADEVLARHQALDEFAVINKPFYLAELARSLRSVLHGT
jgi:signal transduction histidine kinase/CheY-like chemotaxis protein/HAMP domain-containing protein